MSNNIQKIITVQNSINNVITETPQLFVRLKIVLQESVIMEKLNQAPTSNTLIQIIGGNTPNELLDPGYAHMQNVTRDHYEFKLARWEALKQEAMEFFSKLERVLTYGALWHLCFGGGTLFNLPEGERSRFKLIDLYIQYCTDDHFAYERERMWSLSSAPSSDEDY